MATKDKLVTLESLAAAHATKLDNDFSSMTELSSLSDTDLLVAEHGGQHYKVPVATLEPTPLAITITSGQWSGSGSDYYISVNASNVTADSILVPHYDGASLDNLHGPIWCVPAAGSFTIHTSALPTGTVTVLIQFVGVMGEANYQVLADVYSTSQTYSKSEAVAKADIVNNLTSTSTTNPLSAAQGKALNDQMANLQPTKTMFKTYWNIPLTQDVDIGFSPSQANGGATIIVFNANVGLFSLIRFESGATSAYNMGAVALSSVTRNGTILTLNFATQAWGTTALLCFRN